MVQLLEGGEVPPFEEILSDELDTIFHLPLRRGAVGMAEPRGERVVGGEVEEQGVELALGGEVGPSQHHGLEMVIEDLFRESSEVVEGVLMATEEVGVERSVTNSTYVAREYPRGKRKAASTVRWPSISTWPNIAQST